jgi:hypothetical protein
MDHEILSTFALHPRLLWNAQMFITSLVNWKQLILVNCFDSLPRNNAEAELCSGKFKMANCHDQEGQQQKPPPLSTHT